MIKYENSVGGTTDESHGTGHSYEMKWKCGDLKCVQKPTRGRLSLTHLLQIAQRLKNQSYQSFWSRFWQNCILQNSLQIFSAPIASLQNTFITVLSP